MPFEDGGSTLALAGRQVPTDLLREHNFTIGLKSAGTLTFTGAQNITSTSNSNLTINPTGNLVFDPTGNYVNPNVNYDVNLGAINKKYLTLNAAELHVETLVAQNTIATIGGRILVGPTTILTSDLSGSNLISNPSFEISGSGGGTNVFANWNEIWNSGSIVQDGSTYHDGSYSCKLITSSSANAPYVYFQRSVVEYQGFTLSFWTKGDGTNAGKYAIVDDTHSTFIISPTSTSATGTSWTRVSKEFNVPLSASAISIAFFGPEANGGIAYFDDCYMVYSIINVKHNNLSDSSIIYLNSGSYIEFMQLYGGPYGSGSPYYYYVFRDLDGTGPNDWYAGDAVFNTGRTNEGFIDIYSFSSIAGSQIVGPTIAGNIRNSTIYNDWAEHWAIGNLHGLYGYGVDTWGIGLGKYAANNPHITIDSGSGIKIYNGLSTVVGQWDTSGNILVGQIGSNQNNIYISSGSIKIRNNITDRINMTGAGVLTINDSSGSPVLTFDASTGAEITKKLTMPGINSAIAIGATPPSGSANGTGIWIDRNGLYGVQTNIPQVYINGSGILYGGNGQVLIDSNGVTLAMPTNFDNGAAIKWASGSTRYGKIYALDKTTSQILWIENTSDNEDGVTYVAANGGPSKDSLVELRSIAGGSGGAFVSVVEVDGVGSVIGISGGGLYVGSGYYPSSVNLTPAGTIRLSNDIYTVPWTDYSDSSVVLGWSGSSGNIYYKKIGKLVFVNFYIQGTSSSALSSFTLPYSNNSQIATLDLIAVADNTTWQTLPGHIRMGTSASKVDCYKTILDGSWTASGSKIVQGQFWYETV